MTAAHYKGGHHPGNDLGLHYTALPPIVASCPYSDQLLVTRKYWSPGANRPSQVSTNSSFGCGGSGVFLSFGSLGLRRNLPSSTSLKPAASTSWRRKVSSIRCKVPDSDMPVPGRPACDRGLIGSL